MSRMFFSPFYDDFMLLAALANFFDQHKEAEQFNDVWSGDDTEPSDCVKNVEEQEQPVEGGSSDLSVGTNDSEVRIDTECECCKDKICKKEDECKCSEAKCIADLKPQTSDLFYEDCLFPKKWLSEEFGGTTEHIRLSEDGSEYLYNINVKGLNKDKVSLSEKDGSLEITYDDSVESTTENGAKVSSKQSFHTVLSLPKDAEANDTIAEFNDDILMIRVPVRKERKTSNRVIKIN